MDPRIFKLLTLFDNLFDKQNPHSTGQFPTRIEFFSDGSGYLKRNDEIVLTFGVGASDFQPLFITLAEYLLNLIEHIIEQNNGGIFNGKV